MGNSLQNSWTILLDSLDTMHSVLVDSLTVVIDNDVSETRMRLIFFFFSSLVSFCAYVCLFSFVNQLALAYGKDEIQVLLSSLNAIFSTSQYLSDSVVLSLLKELNKRY
jgi:hypothetical protein